MTAPGTTACFNFELESRANAQNSWHLCHLRLHYVATRGFETSYHFKCVTAHINFIADLEASYATVLHVTPHVIPTFCASSDSAAAMRS